MSKANEFRKRMRGQLGATNLHTNSPHYVADQAFAIISEVEEELRKVLLDREGRLLVKQGQIKELESELQEANRKIRSLENQLRRMGVDVGKG